MWDARVAGATLGPIGRENIVEKIRIVVDFRFLFDSRWYDHWYPGKNKARLENVYLKRLCSRLFELCKIERSWEIKEIITLSLPLYVVSQSVDHHHRKVRSKSRSNWFETWNRLNGFDFKVPRLLTRTTRANLNLILVQFPFSTFYACFEVIQVFRPICWSRLSIYRDNCKLPRFRHLPNNVWSDAIFDRFEGKRVSWLWSRSRIWRNLSCLILLNPIVNCTTYTVDPLTPVSHVVDFRKA